MLEETIGLLKSQDDDQAKSIKLKVRQILVGLSMNFLIVNALKQGYIAPGQFTLI